jgi:hypothetical protein
MIGRFGLEMIVAARVCPERTAFVADWCFSYHDAP